jgi:hypothetical protein
MILSTAQLMLMQVSGLLDKNMLNREILKINEEEHQIHQVLNDCLAMFQDQASHRKI